MLCLLGAVVFAVAAARHVRTLTAFAVGLVASVWLVSPGRMPDAATTGALATIAAAVHLFRPRWRIATAVCGGALAGVMSVLLEIQGVPAVVSPVAPVLVSAVAVWLARTRVTFAPEALRDEGMLAIAALGFAVAVLPGILDGWQAATNLSAASSRQAAASVPLWTLAVLLVSSSLGALYSFWSRR